MKKSKYRAINRFGARALSVLLILLISILCLASCSSSNDGDKNYSEKPSAGDSYNSDMGMSGNEYGEKSESSIDDGRKIIYNANVNAETKDFDKATAELEKMTEQYGGYIQTSSVSGNSYSSSSARRASYTLRIPSDKFREFLSAFGELVNVTNTSLTSDDITDKYYDIEARLETLESQRQALQKILEESKDLDYMMTVQDKLYNVIYEIEKYKAQLNRYDVLTDNATIVVSLCEVIEHTQTVANDQTYFDKLGDAFKESWADFADGCADFSIWLVSAIPTLLTLAAIVIAAILIIRAISKRERQRSAKRREEYRRRHNVSDDSDKNS